MQSYETLLKKAKAQLPEKKEATERFEIPKVMGRIEGNKTIITNYLQICQTLRREPEQILKYLQRELAVPASIDGPRLVLGSKIPSKMINQKVFNYAHSFVICKECKKPDTKIIKEGRISFLKCLACGAKHPIKSKI
jgi:translation initiation factor 2 subunit 2